MAEASETMNATIHAIYANGVFRPVESVSLPENSNVEISIRDLGPAPPSGVPISEGLAKIYAILGERYNSGHSDTAARHNEHQP